MIYISPDFFLSQWSPWQQCEHANFYVLSHQRLSDQSRPLDS